MTKNQFSVTVSADEVLAQAKRLDGINGATINALLTRVVTQAAGQFDVQARRAMNAGIALDDGYISSRMDLHDEAGIPRVTITTAGPGQSGQRGLTILGHYSPAVTYVAGKGPTKGDPKRGVPAGQRAAGVQVSVRRGQPKVIPGAFTMTLLRGTKAGDKTGVFIREGGKVKHLYGVSPYSLFRFQINAQSPAWSAELERATLAALEAL